MAAALVRRNWSRDRIQAGRVHPRLVAAGTVTRPLTSKGTEANLKRCDCGQAFPG